MILQNAIRYIPTGEILISYARHNLMQSSDEKAFVDGGLDYFRRGGDIRLMEDLSLIDSSPLEERLDKAIVVVVGGEKLLKDMTNEEIQGNMDRKAKLGLKVPAWLQELFDIRLGKKPIPVEINSDIQFSPSVTPEIKEMVSQVVGAVNKAVAKTIDDIIQQEVYDVYQVKSLEELSGKGYMIQKKIDGNRTRLDIYRIEKTIELP